MTRDLAAIRAEADAEVNDAAKPGGAADVYRAINDRVVATNAALDALVVRIAAAEGPQGQAIVAAAALVERIYATRREIGRIPAALAAQAAQLTIDLDAIEAEADAVVNEAAQPGDGADVYQAITVRVVATNAQLDALVLRIAAAEGPQGQAIVAAAALVERIYATRREIGRIPAALAAQAAQLTIDLDAIEADAQAQVAIASANGADYAGAIVNIWAINIRLDALDARIRAEVEAAAEGV